MLFINFAFSELCHLDIFSNFAVSQLRINVQPCVSSSKIIHIFSNKSAIATIKCFKKCSPKTCFWHNSRYCDLFLARYHCKQSLAKLLARKEVDEEVEGGVETGKETVGEGDEVEAPEGRTTLVDLVHFYCFINIQSNSDNIKLLLSQLEPDKSTLW